MTTMAQAPNILQSATTLLFRMVDERKTGYLFGLWRDGSHLTLPLKDAPTALDVKGVTMCQHALISLMKAGCMETPMRGKMQHIPLGQPFPARKDSEILSLPGETLLLVQKKLSDAGMEGFLLQIRREDQAHVLRTGELGKVGDDGKAVDVANALVSLIMAGVFTPPAMDQVYVLPKRLSFPGSNAC